MVHIRMYEGCPSGGTCRCSGGALQADRNISESSPEIWRRSGKTTGLQVPVSARIRDYSSIGYASAGSLPVYDHGYCFLLKIRQRPDLIFFAIIRSDMQGD